MEGRIEKADCAWAASERFKDACEIGALCRKQLCDCAGPFLQIFGENHFAYVIDAIPFEEHMLGATKSDSLSTESDGMTDLIGLIGIGTHF